MAQFTKVNGDYLPVINMDAGEYENQGLNAVQANVTVQPQGPKLQFFTVEGDGALSGAQVNTIILATEQLSTVHMYEFSDAANNTVAMALYPTDAWTALSLENYIANALTDAGTANAVVVSSGASFTG